MSGEVLEAGTGKNSAYVCLFWLSDDSKSVTEINGNIEFTESDLLNKVTLDPIGMHDNYRKNPYSFNRGRVSLVGGTIEIMVGRNCSDEFLQGIMSSLGLNMFKVTVVKTGMYDK